jgi:demethylmenaquinone methyltransferase / 2-methoxy-6-polyprenyl-1,4-benzoquinol methylase
MNYQKNQPDTIQALFDSIATDYDRTNAILSFQLHKKWNRELIRQVSHNNPSLLLDLCSGTGEIAFTFFRTSEAIKRAILVDFSSNMLECAKAKAKLSSISEQHLQFLQADVQELPLSDHSVSCATMAYGIRNVKDPLKCFQEVYRVLSPDSYFGILELTRPTNPLLKFGHQVYLRNVLPLVGKWFTRNQEAYDYLCSSIGHFTPPQTLVDQLKSVGFQNLTIKPLSGGIATIITAHRL